MPPATEQHPPVQKRLSSLARNSAATPDYIGGTECQLLTQAAAAGAPWAQTFLRLALQRQGRALFTPRMFNPEMAGLAHPIASQNVLPGPGRGRRPCLAGDGCGLGQRRAVALGA